jgi:pimeloyl-ACP methyl ester carboxylesterase
MKWIFIRGLVREAGHWHTFPRAFAARFREAEIHYLEIPGTGQRYRETSRLHIEEVAQDFQRELTLLRSNWPEGEKPWIFAISLGGMVTLEWLRQQPGQFAGAVLINTSVSGMSPFFQRLQPPNYPHILRLLATLDPEVRERKLLTLVSNEPPLHQTVAKRFGAIQHARPVSRENALRQLAAAARYRLESAPQGQPILILNSSGDRFVHPACSERLAEFLNAPLATHPAAGHDLPLDAPEWVLARVEDWLKEHRAIYLPPPAPAWP